MNLPFETPLHLLNPKQKVAPRVYRPFYQYRAMLLEVVSLHPRFFYRYLSSEGLTGIIQSSHMDIIETPKPTPMMTNRTGHPAESVNHSGNYGDISSSWYTQVPRSDLRQRAKACLKELYPLKIGFPQLVKEGIEPKLLMELYAEIGIAIPPSSPQNIEVNGTETNHEEKDLSTLHHKEPHSVSTSTSHVIIPQQKRDNSSKDSLLGGRVPESLGTTGEPTPKDSHSGIVQNRSFPKQIDVPQAQTHGELRTQIVNSTAAQTSTTYPKTAASTSKLTKAPTATILGKPTITKSGEKALERKDYIARMLAAKAGRPIPALSTLPTKDNATNQPQESQSKPGSPKQANPDDEGGLLIGNLSYQATESDLKLFFSAFPM